MELRPDLSRDRIRIDGQVPSGREEGRVVTVVDQLRAAARTKTRVRVESRNPNVDGKGLGFSASGFAALGLATSKALDLDLSYKELSQIVRLGSGSAARSLVGGFSIWYANRNGQSYAEQLAPPSSVQLKTVIVPVPSKMKTDRAHVDAVTSPLFDARLVYLRGLLSKMKRAIARKDTERICQLAEMDTLNLHAITMTGEEGTVLFSPLSIRIMSEVRRLREEENMHAWYSLDTGPSVFVNTTSDHTSLVRKRIARVAGETVVSDPGGPAATIEEHLF